MSPAYYLTAGALGVSLSVILGHALGMFFDWPAFLKSWGGATDVTSKPVTALCGIVGAACIWSRKSGDFRSGRELAVLLALIILSGLFQFQAR